MSNFVFTKKVGLVSRPEGMPAPGPYYTTLVEMKDVAGFPYDFALYFSTDHDKGAGGVWLYVCDGGPTDAAGWSTKFIFPGMAER